MDSNSAMVFGIEGGERETLRLERERGVEERERRLGKREKFYGRGGAYNALTVKNRPLFTMELL